jgi:sugar phosphate isomerase/epimerase
MEYGVVCGPELASAVAKAGYTFIEATVGALLKPLESEAAFRDTLAQYRACGLPCPAVNCFVPAQIKITGPTADMHVLRDYVATVFTRAREAGVGIVVFGSAGARNIPEGFDRGKAWAQIVDFTRMIAPMAEKHGVLVVIEPLNRKESNVLNTVGEGARLAAEVNHPSVQLLVDGFHWARDNDSAEDIVRHGVILRHAHIGTPQNRMIPGAEDFDFGPFFTALRKANYNGRISVEARIPDPGKDLARALDLMRHWESGRRSAGVSAPQ